MLTFTGKAVLVAEQRQRDMVAQVEQARLEVKPAQGNSLSSRWLYVFGEQLVSWGCRLQTRYRRSLPQLGDSSRCDAPAVRSAVPRHI